MMVKAKNLQLANLSSKIDMLPYSAHSFPKIGIKKYHKVSKSDLLNASLIPSVENIYGSYTRKKSVVWGHFCGIDDGDLLAQQPQRFAKRRFTAKTVAIRIHVGRQNNMFSR